MFLGMFLRIPAGKIGGTEQGRLGESPPPPKQNPSIFGWQTSDFSGLGEAAQNQRELTTRLLKWCEQKLSFFFDPHPEKLG